MVLQVLNGQRKKISAFGDDYNTSDGTCIRDYVHVTDLAHIQALDYLLAGGKSDVFNLSNGVGFSVKKVIEVARQVTGHSIPLQIAPSAGGRPRPAQDGAGGGSGHRRRPVGQAVRFLATVK